MLVGLGLVGGSLVGWGVFCFFVFCLVFGFCLGAFLVVCFVRLVLDALVGFLVVVGVGSLFVVVCFLLLRHWTRFVQVRHSSGIWFGFWGSFRCSVLWMHVALLV